MLIGNKKKASVPATKNADFKQVRIAYLTKKKLTNHKIELKQK